MKVPEKMLCLAVNAELIKESSCRDCWTHQNFLLWRNWNRAGSGATRPVLGHALPYSVSDKHLMRINQTS